MNDTIEVGDCVMRRAEVPTITSGGEEIPDWESRVFRVIWKNENSIGLIDNEDGSNVLWRMRSKVHSTKNTGGWHLPKFYKYSPKGKRDIEILRYSL